MSMHACMPIPESGGEDAIGTSGPGVETGGGIGVPDRFSLVARTLLMPDWIAMLIRFARALAP